VVKETHEGRKRQDLHVQPKRPILDVIPALTEIDRQTDVIGLTPVTLPPGRLRLLTKPDLTGSRPLRNTIGIVVVAALAASTAGGETA
jgi:hypothetical protein